MNTPQDPTSIENRPEVDEQRRRLTKGGLAAPVVLGTLLSRPVLGAPYHNCTISGQMSGNVSTHEQGTCAIGRSPGYWKQQGLTSWPTASGWTPSQPFNGSTADGATLSNAFWVTQTCQANSKFDFVDSSVTGASPATMLQVLDSSLTCGDAGGAPRYADLARAVIASVLNFYDGHGTTYGIRPSEAIQMYVSVFSNADHKYVVSPTVKWTADQCITYLSSLYT